MGKRRPADRRLRMLDWSIRDEDGVAWDRQAGWIGAADIRPILTRASRAIVHVEATRELRTPLCGELERLIAQVADDGHSGDVCVSEYRRGRELLLRFSVVDRPQSGYKGGSKK